MRYKEWDTLLSSGLWEPEAITEKLPEFLEFVKEAQAFLFHDKGKLSLITSIILSFL